MREKALCSSQSRNAPPMIFSAVSSACAPHGPASRAFAFCCALMTARQMRSPSAEPSDGIERCGIGAAVDGTRVKSLLRKPPLQILPELGGPDLRMCGEGLHSHVVFRLQRPQNQPRGLGAIALQAEQAGLVGGAEIVQPDRIPLLARPAAQFHLPLHL